MDTQHKTITAGLEKDRKALLTTAVEGQKKRGGQPANHNARKHGFSANTLTPEQQEALLETLDLRDFEQKVALVRVKLLTLRKDPDTPPELISGARNNLCRTMETQRRYRFG